MNPPVLLTGVTARYRRRVVLRRVSLAVEEGECVGVYGPNGAGKSTLLRLILGLLRPVEGEARTLGMVVARRDFRRVRPRIGYVPQAHAVDPRLPIRLEEAVLSGRAGRMGWRRRPDQRDLACARRAMEDAGLAALAHRPFGQCSGGEQQRALVARALAQEPELLLLDEPTSSLDRAYRLDLCRRLRQAHEARRLTTLVVSHDEDALGRLCDRIVTLRAGRIEHEEMPDAFMRRLHSEGAEAWR